MSLVAQDQYTEDWAGENGLGLGDGFCVTIVRAVEPESALKALGVPAEDVQSQDWSELVANALRDEDSDEVPMAAFVVGDHTVVVEMFGYRGTLEELTGPLSRGTEVTSVFLNGGTGRMDLRILRDGVTVAFVDGDYPEHVYAGDAFTPLADEELSARLSELVRGAVKPFEEDDEVPEEFDDGWVDLLQVACEYTGATPRVEDVNGPMAGAVISLLVSQKARGRL